MMDGFYIKTLKEAQNSLPPFLKYVWASEYLWPCGLSIKSLSHLPWTGMEGNPTYNNEF